MINNLFESVCKFTKQMYVDSVAGEMEEITVCVAWWFVKPFNWKSRVHEIFMSHVHEHLPL